MSKYTVRPLGGTTFAVGEAGRRDGGILFECGMIGPDGQWIETEDLEEAARFAADLPDDAEVELRPAGEARLPGGIPPMLARLEDAICENLPRDDAMAWPERFLAAARPGAGQAHGETQPGSRD